MRDGPPFLPLLNGVSVIRSQSGPPSHKCDLRRVLNVFHGALCRSGVSASSFRLARVVPVCQTVKSGFAADLSGRFPPQRGGEGAGEKRETGRIGGPPKGAAKRSNI